MHCWICDLLHAKNAKQIAKVWYSACQLNMTFAHGGISFTLMLHYSSHGSQHVQASTTSMISAHEQVSMDLDELAASDT